MKLKFKKIIKKKKVSGLIISKFLSGFIFIIDYYQEKII